MNNNKGLVDIGQLAARLKLPIRWLKTEAKAGRLPCLRVGRRWFFDALTVDQTLAERASRRAGEVLE